MDKGKRLLPGQFTMDEALVKAIEAANKAYVEEAYQYEWPEEDRKALNVPKWKAPGWRPLLAPRCEHLEEKVQENKRQYYED